MQRCRGKKFGVVLCEKDGIGEEQDIVWRSMGCLIFSSD